ncbi:hypothetical protein MUU72_12760 [Streptomyces sp. RS10V-4]|uniref:hypothetical protein n=1 Tax=Streptomyces rhizoryzae TaxID=2932493 RepID=UPI00200452EB|nr:hypothetical protein [Streptomyces rhizoryzae]MCK7623958.1 hypothetical protein [Streptomyces rhizoryzae]
MTQVIATLLTPLLRLLLPAPGRHRASVPPPTAARREDVPPAGPPLRPPVRTPPPLLGAEVPLVRPYVLSEAERAELRARRRRRRALWLAVHGIDIGPRRIHGVEVAA